MKQEIKIKLPVSTTATLSIEDNWAVVEVVPVKTELEVGKWYYDGQSDHIMLYIAANELYGFNSKREWNKWFILASNTKWQPADPKEVTRLLIGEAEKRGFKTNNHKHGSEIREKCIGVDFDWCGVGCVYDNVSLNVIFEFETGKWAEIIPEKKPLYTNSYGTSFFEGDEYRCIRLNTAKILETQLLNSSNEAMGNEIYTEIMTERECHRYLDENWDELNKNK